MKVLEYIKVKDLDYFGGGWMIFDMKMVILMLFDMNNVKFDLNNGNFMRDFDLNIFLKKGNVLFFNKMYWFVISWRV